MTNEQVLAEFKKAGIRAVKPGSRGLA